MKKTVVNIMCSTGITLVLLAIVATLFGGSCLFISSVFESLLANIFIHTGLMLTYRFESNYALLEVTLDIGYTIAVVLTSGAVFDWYSSTPVWVLVIMSVTVYLLGVLLSTFRMRKDLEEINRLIKKRNGQSSAKELTE